MSGVSQARRRPFGFCGFLSARVRGSCDGADGREATGTMRAAAEADRPVKAPLEWPSPGRVPAVGLC
eukprot:scaffold19767_cov51-Phaeocystis_antarctica.AAC.1